MITVLITKFDVSSEAYEAYSNVKNDPATDSITISQCALVKRQGGQFTPVENFNTGINTSDDMWRGGLIGSLFGILCGPLGMLFTGSMGALVGSAIDTDDAIGEKSIVEKVLADVGEDGMYLVVTADETNVEFYDSKVGRYAGKTTRYDAAEVQAEIERAAEIEKDLRKRAKKEMREKKGEEFKARMEAKKAEWNAKVEAFKQKLAAKKEN